MSKIEWINKKFKTLDCEQPNKTDAEELMCNIGQLVFWAVVFGVVLLGIWLFT